MVTPLDEVLAPDGSRESPAPGTLPAVRAEGGTNTGGRGATSPVRTGKGQNRR